MTAPEIWKPVPDWEDLYAVSNYGRVESYHRATPRILRAGRRPDGYMLVVLCRDGEQTSRTVHSLVLVAFAGSRPAGQEARHLDGNPANNRWEPGDEEETRKAGGNLIYGTSGTNNRDQVEHGTHNKASRKKCRKGHDYTAENTILADGPSGQHRICRKCSAARSEENRKREAEAPVTDEERCTDKEGCDRRAVVNKLCRKHYMRQWQRDRAAAKAA